MKPGMMKKTLLASVFVVLVSGSALSRAEPQYCGGTLNGVHVLKNGALVINGIWRDQWTQVCRLPVAGPPLVADTPWKGISSAVCKDWYSMIQAAVVSRSPVVVKYTSAPACSALPIYGDAPAPYYLMLQTRPVEGG